MTNAAGCGDSICIDKPIVVEKGTNIGSLSRKTLTQEIYPERPMYRTEFGRVTWRLLHRMSVLYPSSPSEEEKNAMTGFFNGLERYFPCKVCADHFKKEITVLPPKVENNKDLAGWLCYQHNQVNKRIHKQTIFDCSNLAKLFEDYKI